MSYLGVVDFDASLVPPHPGPFAGGGVGQKAELVAVAAGGLRVRAWKSGIGRSVDARGFSRSRSMVPGMGGLLSGE